MLRENDLPAKRRERSRKGFHWFTDTGKVNFITNILGGSGDKQATG